MSTRQLTRSTTDVRFAGVCGGIAEYLEIDPTLVRLAFVVLTLWLGIVPGCVAYLLMMVNSLLVRLFCVAAIALMTMVYFRLIGRLAWAIFETSSVEDDETNATSP